ncbi:hypothetical protein D3C73_1273670 [compost metagenome]
MFLGVIYNDLSLRKQANKPENDDEVFIGDMEQILEQFASTAIKTSNGQTEAAKTVVHELCQSGGRSGTIYIDHFG